MLQNTLLPIVASFDEYKPLYRNPEVWRPAVEVICGRHGLDAASLVQSPAGTHVVFAAGPDRIIKLFAPMWKEDAIPESLLIAHLAGKLGVPTPEPVAEGEIEGWPYIVMSRLRGQMLGEVWREVPFGDKLGVVEEVGELMARLHALPTEGLGALAVDWSAFMDARRAECIERQTRCGMDGAWLEELEAFLGELPGLYPPQPPTVLLSADITEDHILLEERGGRWRVAGFYDFGDAMIGHHLYEFAAPAAFFTRGHPRLLEALFLSYGTPAEAIDEGLSARLAAYIALHKYSNIPALARATVRDAPLSSLADFFDEVSALPSRSR